jgi:hypothetical protein
LTAAAAVFKGNVKNEDKDSVAQMEWSRKLIIGAINKLRITAGFEIALTCDILVVSTSAKFINTHAKSIFNLDHSSLNCGLSLECPCTVTGAGLVYFDHGGCHKSYLV